jgi:signal transduction histidine kinase
MNVRELFDLAALLQRERETLLAEWRAQVRQLPSARELDVPALNDHVPALVDELVEALESVSDETISDALLAGSPPAHGIQRQEDGFDIVEVVAEYNILRGCIHEVAERNGVALRGTTLHILNRVLDEAIGLAVQTYATHQALEVQSRREEYLAFVAHDLRTPLNAITLAAHVLDRALPHDDNEDAARLLTTLHRNAHHLQSLVERVLKESAHVDPDVGMKLERRTFDLWPLVGAVIHDLRPVADTSSTQLVNEVPIDLAVFADAGLLRRVFQNLVANGITYAPRGTVVIGARAFESDSAIECWVRDDGAGIAADRVEHIFEKLETDPAKDNGYGLGLAIVKSFIEAHGGTIDVETKIGSGATFRFTLPMRSN